MPFQSKAQMRAAFAGALGPEMQGKAREWAHETPDLKRLPEHVKQAHHQAKKQILMKALGHHG